jgi:hypothetical protein
MHLRLGLCLAPSRYSVGVVNTYPYHRGRRTAALIVWFLVLLVLIAVVVGVGWWVWDYLIDNPMPYRDPEPPER